MTEHLFTVRIELTDGIDHEIEYGSVIGALNDKCLRILFDSELVKTCSVHTNSMRITAGPITTWERLKHQLTTNSSTLLRGAQ